MPPAESRRGGAPHTGAGRAKREDRPNHRHDRELFREDIERCLEAGMDEHIGKPLDFEEVFDLLRKYLRP